LELYDTQVFNALINLTLVLPNFAMNEISAPARWFQIRPSSTVLKSFRRGLCCTFVAVQVSLSFVCIQGNNWLHKDSLQHVLGSGFLPFLFSSSFLDFVPSSNGLFFQIRFASSHYLTFQQHNYSRLEVRYKRNGRVWSGQDLQKYPWIGEVRPMAHWLHPWCISQVGSSWYKSRFRPKSNLLSGKFLNQWNSTTLSLDF
jgi:hypothetical protein